MKRSAPKLSIAAPEPVIAPIPVSRPFFGEEEGQAVNNVLRSGWVTQGPEVLAFEKEFAQFVNAPYAVAVSNCTAALHLALSVVGVKQGDEVITVSHSFIATANSIRYCGAIPVFVDIDPKTLGLDPSALEASITEKTKAILCVHQIGIPCDLAAIVKIAKKHGIPVVEDAACAAGSQIRWENKWEYIGAPHSDIACYSFHPRKLLTTGDGGMITTANEEWALRLQKLRQHAMSLSDLARHHSGQVNFESYLELGYNYRLTDIQSAVGRVQLKRLPHLLAKRRELAERYRAQLQGLPLSFIEEPEDRRTNWQSFYVRLADGISQPGLMQFMASLGIATRRGVMCAHREPAFQKEPWRCGLCGPKRNLKCDHLVNGEQAQDRGLMLPLFEQLTTEEQDRVIQGLKSFFRGPK